MSDITTSVAQYFIPEIWAQTALEVLRNQIVMARLAASDGDITGNFQVGSVLHIPYPGTFSANDKAEGSPVTLQTPSGSTEVQVTLNKHKEVSFLVEDVVNAQANQDVMMRYMESAIIAIAEQVETDLWGVYADATHHTGAAGTDVDAAAIRAARKQLNVQKAPMGGRALVVSPKDEISILGDSSLATYFAFAQQQAVREGSIGRAYGFDIFMSQLAPSIAGTPVKQINFAFAPQAFMLASRPFKPIPAGAGAIVTTVRDPISGLVLRLIAAFNANYLGMQITLDTLYGVKLLRDAKALQVWG